MAPVASVVAYPSSGHAPLAVRFDGTGSRDDVGVAQTQWDFGDGASAVGAVANHTFTSAGTYTAKVTATDAAGNRGTAETQITVTAPADAIAPQARFVPQSTSGLAPLAVHFDGSGSSDNVAVASYQWDFGDGASSSLQIVDHVFASAGSFAVVLTVRDAAGNSATAQGSVTATAPPMDTLPPKAVLVASPLAGLAPLVIHLDGSGSTDDVGVTRWQYDLGDGRELDGAIQDVTYAVAGRYPIVLTVSDAAGHSDSATVTASVETLPVTPAENLYVDSLHAPWTDWSWATSCDLAAMSPVHTGTSSIRFTPKNWEGVRFHHGANGDAGFDTTGYDRISIWVHGGGTGNQKLLVSAETASGLGSELAFETYLQGGAVSIAANLWAQALIPLGALGVSSGAALDSIVIKDGTGASQADVYLDDLTLYPELGGPAVAPCPALPVSNAFVARSGSSLTLAGAPFRGAGANVYYLQSDLANAQQLGNANALQNARQTLDALVCLGMPVVRTWAFNERTASADPASIQPAPGVFREEGLAALDQSIAEAKSRGLRVVLTLLDNWNYYGGIPQYAAWAGKSHDDFFTDATLKGYWKSYVAMLLARTNTVTGIRYRDEPAILAWELGNEFRCEACAHTAKLHAAIAELADYLKSQHPSQLIADGGEGFDDNAGLWSLSNTYPINGNEGASFSTLSAIDSLDLLSYHMYPTNYGLNSTSDPQSWIHTHQQLASQGGKIAYPGEYGWQAADGARAAMYETWLNQLFSTDSAPLGLLWQILPEGVANNDGFGVYYPSDSATLGVLAQWARAVR